MKYFTKKKLRKKINTQVGWKVIRLKSSFDVIYVVDDTLANGIQVLQPRGKKWNAVRNMLKNKTHLVPLQESNLFRLWTSFKRLS